ncbi:hypothetical protein M8J77_018282 [Diaphorina citri]|nr:hypothetical protein M8J77_018282 [Diaphorina citri]
MAIETSITVPSSHHESSKPSHNASYLFSWIEINVTYFKTVPGIVKLLQLVNQRKKKKKEEEKKKKKEEKKKKKKKEEEGEEEGKKKSDKLITPHLLILPLTSLSLSGAGNSQHHVTVQMDTHPDINHAVRSLTSVNWCKATRFKSNLIFYQF